MNWQYPQALYLILPLCVGWFVLALESDRRRRRARAAFVAPAMWSRILPEESRTRFIVKLLLREAAIVAGLVALAGPRFGTEYEQVVPRGADLYVLIDVSRSMLADDVVPSRLGRAKIDVASLLNRLQGERIGLIAFAGQAVVKCPLTVDYDSFRRSLDELDPDSAPRGGTAIGDAIRKGLEVFRANADRDQAMILITDGDDQQSYPLEAAAVASERQVTLFTIGLGDTERGARIPQKGDGKGYLEYQGEQVWSKLDSNLLEQIALKTSGIYIPAGTRAYDLGELYTNHLQGRRGSDEASQQKIRHSERFQIFLTIALVLLLLDLWIDRHRRPAELPHVDVESAGRKSSGGRRVTPVSTAIPILTAVIGFNCVASVSCAVEPAANVREGLRLYSTEKYDEAKTKFAEAKDELDKRKSADAALAAFDEACAAHRKGDLEVAREAYLRAGLSQDRMIATSAHYNLGTLSAEKARTLSGEKPELIEPSQRQEVLEHLSQAIAAYRHCLELQSDHPSARRNLELIRQWIKYYTDQWAERDRQKRRDESNLLTFLEFIVKTQAALKETVVNLPEPVHSDTLAELKRAQEQLKEEIPTLREKIETQLRPATDPQTGTAPTVSKELEEGIQLLQSWADTAGEKMGSAARRLGGKDPEKAAIDQQGALDELDRIWEGIIPFGPLLSKDLADQTAIAKGLAEREPEVTSSEKERESGDAETLPAVPESLPAATQSDRDPATSSSVAQDSRVVEFAGESLAKLMDQQLRTLKRTQLLVPKAEMELEQLEQRAAADPNSQPDQPGEPEGNASDSAQQAVDLDRAREGFRKAIKLAPEAVKQMDAAVQSLKQQDRRSATRQTEEARRILEEIQRAQPKKDQKQDPKQQDQDKQNKDGDQDQQNDQQDKEQKDQSQDSDDKKSEKEKSEEQGKSAEQRPQPGHISQDRVEDALRKVRERQQEKRERDRKMKGQFLGRVPVDKDW